MQGGGGAVDVMAAPSWAFKKFQEDLGIWLILAVIPMIVLILVSGGINFALGLVSSNTSSFILALALNAITTIVGFALFGLAARGLIRAALAATRGEKPTIAGASRPNRCSKLRNHSPRAPGPSTERTPAVTPAIRRPTLRR